MARARRVYSAVARCVDRECSWRREYSGRSAEKSARRSSKVHANAEEHPVTIVVESVFDYGRAPTAEEARMAESTPAPGDEQETE